MRIMKSLLSHWQKNWFIKQSFIVTKLNTIRGKSPAHYLEGHVLFALIFSTYLIKVFSLNIFLKEFDIIEQVLQRFLTFVRCFGEVNEKSCVRLWKQAKCLLAWYTYNKLWAMHTLIYIGLILTRNIPDCPIQLLH